MVPMATIAQHTSATTLLHIHVWVDCNKETFRVRSVRVIWIRISDPRSLGSWCIKGTGESSLVTDSFISPLMHYMYDPSDPGSLILIQVIPKECTLTVGVDM